MFKNRNFSSYLSGNYNNLIYLFDFEIVRLSGKQLSII